MAATLSVYPWPKGIDNSQHRIHVNGVCAVAGTYAAGGFALSWTTMVDSVTGQAVILNTTSTAPFIAWFQSAAGTGYVYQYNVSTNKLQIFVVEAVALSTQYALTELANGTVPAGVSGDTIQFEAEFVRAVQ